MRDGTRLATDVYLPLPLHGRVPGVLVRACYGKSSRRLDIEPVARHLNSRGYGVVVQDVRGTFRSGGERTPWLHEADDGFDTIDWVVRQSWCDERVAMLGDSYLGFTQWAAAASAHPGLRAIAPRVASERVPDAWFASDVAASAGVDWLARWWSGPGMLDFGALDWQARPFLDVIPADFRNARELHREFLSLNEAELHAAIYPVALPAARLAVPALHSGAWFDVMTPYQMRDWSVVAARSPAAGDQFLVMAAEDHSGNPLRTAAAAAGTMADVAASARTRRLDLAAEFFDRYVRGEASARPIPRVRYEVAGLGWRTAGRWPPAEAHERCLYLTGAADATRTEDGGGLSDEPGQGGEANWVHDPARPVPSLVADDNAMLGPGLPDERALPEPGPGLPDERALHRREDVLTFTGEPAPRPLLIAGPVAADVVVSSTAPSMHLVATLTDVSPGGRAGFVLEGVARIDTRYGPASATVQLGSTAYRVPAGHRLRLAIASSRYPRYLVHPGTGDNLWTAVAARPSRQALTTGRWDGSRLRLSTLPA